MKEKIKNWFASDRNIETLKELAKEAGVIIRFSDMQLNEKHIIDSIYYQICVANGLADFYDYNNFFRVVDVATPTEITKPKKTNKKQKVNDDKEAATLDIQNYSYQIPYEQLPPQLQALVMEKTKLYNHKDILQKKLASAGDANDKQTMTVRANLFKQIQTCVNDIIRIHNTLKLYEETNKMPAKDFLLSIKTNYGAIQNN